MNSEVAARLLEINREFYNRFGDSFSATRKKLQPGVKKVLYSLEGDESVLDLGCGNGFFLLEAAKRGHRAAVLGVDFSLPLLRDAESQPGRSSVTFREVDLTQLSLSCGQLSMQGGWDLITTFATLHHIPSHDIRLDILKTVKLLLKKDGKFILSNWQFLNSGKLKSRIQPWSRVGLSDSDMDEGDYLLDWRGGGEGLRYAHHFTVEELLQMAEQAGMRASESFLSDGENGKLGLYQVWKPA